MEHTKECQASYDKWQAEANAYTSYWPNHCKSCHGYGVFYSPGNRWEPPSTDPCDECVCNGKCPRCGELTFEDDTLDICSKCGFNLTNGVGGPQDFECNCWDSYEDDLLQVDH